MTVSAMIQLLGNIDLSKRKKFGFDNAVSNYKLNEKKLNENVKMYVNPKRRVAETVNQVDVQKYNLFLLFSFY